MRVGIEDNGTGIHKEAQSRIFTMLQRLTDDELGIGIGLAIVRTVVEQMGGQVGVASEVGKGSRFWVDLKQVMSTTAISQFSGWFEDGIIDAFSKQFVPVAS